jgi:hypothetical protein
MLRWIFRLERWTRPPPAALAQRLPLNASEG